MPESNPLIIQIVGFKNTGKTTLVCRLVERFKSDGRIVATLKHDAHAFEMDHPDTDTWRHRQAGADITAIASPDRTAILYDQTTGPEELVSAVAARGADVVVVEGFKSAGYPKLVLIKHAEDAEVLLQLSRPAAAVVWPDTPLHDLPPGLPVIAIDDIDGIYAFVRDGKRACPT
ncbi:molybdopterin-guanine dinucleotide biosynthesis protein B [Paenibacillus darwinianus]|uniref:Molybdopterin-guanine dinucleotide biosynthesis protein B n=1 Tax=Paenibacillus darwinianus TaxID=1380763 RepID=A0A9W5RZU6_9BACL|nr:molybdopterin-guanine dinucleotide biosynthesis protein B [Paenibacillus darwinianus]EXX85027.1 molybdopterin-guanine dinucleotide biosynthesis protein B [Paenibacillus darwinianus]EXX86700.1 molybdopterin-guanine dinucleotide biosynthesis protein B [Paenibacillus darwinianus]EXX88914.1 molybdopterin-guanine dinucleotide biosynthesis protein B [Paenibacillus darwinianus]